MQITDITLTPPTMGNKLLRIQTVAGVEGRAEVPGANRMLPEREAVFGPISNRSSSP